MKKKGFTLIELLAVIVILAVLSLILTPVVLRIINNSREESRKESLKLYSSAVESAVLNHQMTSHNKILGTFTTSDDGHTLTNVLSNEKITVDFTKSKVECGSIVVQTSGEIKLNSCTVGNSDTLYSYSTFDEEVTVVDDEEQENQNSNAPLVISPQYYTVSTVELNGSLPEDKTDSIEGLNGIFIGLYSDDNSTISGLALCIGSTCFPDGLDYNVDSPILVDMFGENGCTFIAGEDKISCEDSESLLYADFYGNSNMVVQNGAGDYCSIESSTSTARCL